MRRLAVLILLVCLWAHPAKAENIQLRLVAGFAAGGTSSNAARFLAEAAMSQPGVLVMVESRFGEGGLTAAKWVSDQRDAKTVYVMSSTSAAVVSSDLGLVPVGIFATYEFVAVVRADASPDLKSYMAEAKTNRHFESVGTAGHGSVAHLIGLKLFETNGITMNPVHYTGSAPAVRDLLGGHIPMAIVPRPDINSFKEEFRVIASSGKGIPTRGWMGLYAPKLASAEEIARLVAILRPAAERAGDKLANAGFVPAWRNAGYLRSTHNLESREWELLLRSLNK